MEVVIAKGSAKEIADLVVAMQDQRESSDKCNWKRTDDRPATAHRQKETVLKTNGLCVKISAEKMMQQEAEELEEIIAQYLDAER